MLTSALFANAPNIANFLAFLASDSSGNRWAPPDPGWVSAQPAWDNSTMPVITTTTNVQTTNLDYCYWYGIRLTASGRNGAVVSNVGRGGFEWCQIVNSTSNTAAVAANLGNTNQSRNIVAVCSGTSYDHVVSMTATMISHDNIRVEGNLSATSGNRWGVNLTSNGRKAISRMTVMKNVGAACLVTGSGGSGLYLMKSCIVNNAANGLDVTYSATNSDGSKINKCIVVGNGGFGYSQPNTNNFLVLSDCRFRNNTNGDVSNSQHYLEVNNDFSAGTDADEFVDAAGGDYRIKKTSLLWGRGLGPGDEPASGSLILPSVSAWVA
jgi:hypothetical protein